MIKTGGENVSSREVEEAIYLHPGVAETAVIGLPDPRWVEAVTAFVVAREGMRSARRNSSPTAERSCRRSRCRSA